MTVSVTADSAKEALRKLGIGERRADIRIIWRRGEMHDYRPFPETGCIVDATCVPGEEVHRSFKTAAEAVRYIAAMLKKHDEAVKKIKAEFRKAERERARKAKFHRPQPRSTSS